MTDTNSEVEMRFNEMIEKKSGEERLTMGFSMFDFVREQVVASIKMKKPDAGTEEIKKEIFLRFYGEDFTLTEKEKILKHL